MKSMYDAYQAYERRVIRGEYDNTRGKTIHRSAPRKPLLVQFGDLLINTGLRLKRRYSTGKSMAWSPMTGSKP
jgi:hypothetical protein